MILWELHLGCHNCSGEHKEHGFLPGGNHIKCSPFTVLYVILDVEILIISDSTDQQSDIPDSTPDCELLAFSGCCTFFLSYDISGGSESGILFQKDLYFAICLTGSICASFQMFLGSKYYPDVFSLAP